MVLQRSSGTAPELALRRELHRRGRRYRVDALLPLPGVRRRADVVFGPAKVAVFVDGCFWHGCPEHGNPAVKSNTWYWPEKIAKNRARDDDTDARLLAVGWVSFRAWEHEPAVSAADRLEVLLELRPSRLRGRAQRDQ